MTLRLCFFGTPEAAVPALGALLADPDVEVAAVVTNPDRPSGRGHRLAPPPVKVAAAAAGVAVWQPDRPRAVLDRLRRLAADACAVVAYGSLLPPDVLEAVPAGFVNLHFSLLPAWRGAAPVQHSILHGDRETGVTCFVLEAGMDTGPILATAATPVGADETAGDLTVRLAELGAPVLRDALKGLVAGAVAPRPQDHERATYAPKITPAEARLDWRDDADRLARAVRAFNPVPGAHTAFEGRRLKVHRGRAVDAEPGSSAGPGAVVRADEAGPVVACGGGALRLEEVQPAGKPRMSGAAFANGYRPVGRLLGP